MYYTHKYMAMRTGVTLHGRKATVNSPLKSCLFFIGRLAHMRTCIHVCGCAHVRVPRCGACLLSLSRGWGLARKPIPQTWHALPFTYINALTARKHA